VLGNTLTHFLDREPGREMDNARLLPLTLIDPNPRQARQHFDPEALDELTDSVREFGIIEPILVRPVAGRFVIIAGERRFRAAQAAELAEIPVLVREDLDATEVVELTALENLQRENLSYSDEARQYGELLALPKYHGNKAKLARTLGKDDNRIGRLIALLEQPHLLAAIDTGQLTFTAALARLTTPDRETTNLQSSHDEIKTTDLQSSHGENFLPEDSSAPVLINGQPVAAPLSPRIPRRELDEVAAAATLNAFRPVQRFARFAQALQPANVPVASRPALRQQLQEAVLAAQVAIRALDAEQG